MTPSLAWGSSSQVGGGDVGWLFFLLYHVFSVPPIVATAGIVAQFCWKTAVGEGGLVRSLGWAQPPLRPFSLLSSFSSDGSSIASSSITITTIVVISIVISIRRRDRLRGPG